MNILQPFLARAGATIKGALRVISTGAVRMPVGTTAERPSIEDGLIRYNGSTLQWEKTINGVWVSANEEITAAIQASMNLVLSTPTINNAAMNNSALDAPAITGGTSSGLAVATATINNSTINGSTINTPTVVNPTNGELVLTDSATTNWDTNLGHKARWLINGTARNLNMTNTKVGGDYVILIGLTTPSTQTPNWPANWKWQYDVVPNLTTTNWTLITLHWSAVHNMFLAMAGPGF